MIVMAVFGTAVSAALVFPRTFTSLMLGAVISGWLGVGLFAVFRAELSLQGRRGPDTTYSGTGARIRGLVIVGLSALSAFAALLFHSS